MWTPQIRGLRRDAGILAPALLGLGESRLGPEAAPSMDDYADDVLAWMDETGISRAVVAGLSMGGYVAFAMWRRAPQRVAALVLLDTKAEADGEEARRGRVATRETIAARGMEAVVDGMLEKVLGSTTRRSRPDVVAQVRRMILETDPRGAMAALDALRGRPDSSGTLAGIDVPVTVLVGEEDALTPPDVARDMAARIPGARLVAVPRAGHVTSLEAPDEVTEALRRTLALL
jgi:pimeloyl-ACP methyl ester carboxylesterase